MVSTFQVYEKVSLVFTNDVYLQLRKPLDEIAQVSILSWSLTQSTTMLQCVTQDVAWVCFIVPSRGSRAFFRPCSLLTAHCSLPRPSATGWACMQGSRGDMTKKKLARRSLGWISIRFENAAATGLCLFACPTQKCSPESNKTLFQPKTFNKCSTEPKCLQQR